MEYIIYFLIWYLSGVISFCFILYKDTKTLTYRDLMYGLILGLAGAITFISCFIIYVRELNIWERIKLNIDLDKRIL